MTADTITAHLLDSPLPAGYVIPEELKNAIALAITWASDNPSNSMNKHCAYTYLVNIPQAILEGHEMFSNGTPTERCAKGLRVQLNYVLANCQGYRGEDARFVKKVFKEFINNEN